jgi:hypothetical protein
METGEAAKTGSAVTASNISRAIVMTSAIKIHFGKAYSHRQKLKAKS